MRVIIVNLPMFYLAWVTVLFISTEVDANNSSDKVGKVISTRSKEQIKSNNNVNTTLLVSTIAEATNDSDKIMPTMSKDQTGSNRNVDTTLLVSMSVDVRNSSDTVGQVISTRSEEQIRGNNNVNKKLLFSTPINTTNSSDTLGKVMITKSKEQTGGDNNLDQVLLVLPGIDSKNSIGTVKAAETQCKEQIETSNLNITNLACVNHTMTLQNIGNANKSVQSETKLMDNTNLTTYEDQNDRNFIDGPLATTKPPDPCLSTNNTVLVRVSGVCTPLL